MRGSLFRDLFLLCTALCATATPFSFVFSTNALRGTFYTCYRAAYLLALPRLYAAYGVAAAILSRAEH